MSTEICLPWGDRIWANAIALRLPYIDYSFACWGIFLYHTIMMILQGRMICPGKVEGEALVTSMGISFFGGVDPETGLVVERGHELEGQSIAGKVLVFPTGKGSTVGSYTLYRLKKNGLAPAAILNKECETITAVGCIIAEIPCIDHVPIEQLKTGEKLRVNGAEVFVEDA
jgi:predicted aconitase with swiveling domain